MSVIASTTVKFFASKLSKEKLCFQSISSLYKLHKIVQDFSDLEKVLGVL